MNTHFVLAQRWNLWHNFGIFWSNQNKISSSKPTLTYLNQREQIGISFTGFDSFLVIFRVEHVLVVLSVVLEMYLINTFDGKVTFILRSGLMPSLFSSRRNCRDWNPDAGVRYFLKIVPLLQVVPKFPIIESDIRYFGYLMCRHMRSE